MPFTSTSFFLPHTHSTCFSHVTKEENQAQEYEQLSPGHAPCIGCSCNIKPHSGTMPHSCKEQGLKTFPLLPFTICWKEEESLPPRRQEGWEALPMQALGRLSLRLGAGQRVYSFFPASQQANHKSVPCPWGCRAGVSEAAPAVRRSSCLGVPGSSEASKAWA